MEKEPTRKPRPRLVKTPANLVSRRPSFEANEGTEGPIMPPRPPKRRKAMHARMVMTVREGDISVPGVGLEDAQAFSGPSFALAFLLSSSMKSCSDDTDGAEGEEGGFSSSKTTSVKGPASKAGMCFVAM